MTFLFALLALVAGPQTMTATPAIGLAGAKPVTTQAVSISALTASGDLTTCAAI